MAESLGGSDLESDASSADGGPSSMAWSQTTTTGREQLSKRVDSLQQENRVLKIELDTFRYKCKSLEEENRELKKARVTIVSNLLIENILITEPHKQFATLCSITKVV